MNEPNELLDAPLMRLVPYINAKTLQMMLTLQKSQYGSVVKPFKNVRDLVECDIDDVRSLLVYKLGREYQAVLYDIEEGLALAGLKIKNSEFTPYDIRYERLGFPNTIIEKFKKYFHNAKTAGDISILGKKRLIDAGITYHDISRYIDKAMHKYDMVIESDKKSVLRHSTYAKPVTNTRKKSDSRLTTSIERNEEARKVQRSNERDSSIKVYKLGPDEEVRDGKIVKKVESVTSPKTANVKPQQTAEQSELRAQFWQDVKDGKVVLGGTVTSNQTQTRPTTSPSKPVSTQTSQPKTTVIKRSPVAPISATPNLALLAMSIEEFGFSKRTIEGLNNIDGLKTVGDLANFGKNNLKNSPGIGPGAILEIESLLFKHGIALRNSKSYKKGVFKCYGKNARTITAEEIRKLSLSELRVIVSDQRHGNNNPKKKALTAATALPVETTKTKPATEVAREQIKSTDVSVSQAVVSTPQEHTQSVVKQKQKRVRKSKMVSSQKQASITEPKKVLPEVEIHNLAFALNNYGIEALERVNSLAFAENNSDFDEIKIAVNDYFNKRIASTVEVAPSSTAVDKMKEQILHEMTRFEQIVTLKRESLERSKLDVKRKSASTVLHNSLKSLMNKFYQNIPASGLIAGGRVKLHTFTGPLVQPDPSLEQQQMQ